MATKIEWASESWNIFPGCSKTLDGCEHCYAERMATRLAGNPKTPHYKNTIANGKWTGRVGVAPNKIWNDPLSWKKPRMIFVNSMGDSFRPFTPDSDQDCSYALLDRAFTIIERTPQHIYLFLTKRAHQMKDYFDYRREFFGEILKNVWCGVTVESQQYVDRIQYLAPLSVSVKFLSIEPMLSIIDLMPVELGSLDWVICGAETGQKSRPCQVEWVRNLRDQCVAFNVPFFFKKFANGEREIDGELWEQMPNIKSN